MNLNLLQATSTDTQSPGQFILVILLYAAVFAAFYFFFLRPKSKKQKEDEKMRQNIEVGDDITTIGGIVGRVVSVRDDDDAFLIETGPDKLRMKIRKWSVSTIDNQKTAETVKEEKKGFSLFRKKDDAE